MKTTQNKAFEIVIKQIGKRIEVVNKFYTGQVLSPACGYADMSQEQYDAKFTDSENHPSNYGGGWPEIE